MSFVAAAIFTACCMPPLLKFCKIRGLYDAPNERKVHNNNIPRLGGVLFAPAMTIGMGAAIALMMLRNEMLFPIRLSTFLLFIALFLIFIIGIIDDLVGLKAQIKFGVQFISALIMPICNLYINNLYGFCGIHEIPVWVGYPLTVFVALLIINAINLIDGIDGLASGLGIMLLVSFCLIFNSMESIPYSVFLAGLIGSLLVFFFFNMFGSPEKHTKTFMGDTGSLVLGYAITYITIKYAMFNPLVISSAKLPVDLANPILVSYTLVIVPVFDLIRVAFERIIRGVPMFHPDKTHIHHLFLAAGLSMHKSLACILSLQVMFDIANYLLYNKCSLSSTWIVVFDVAFYSILIVLLKKRGK